MAGKIRVLMVDDEEQFRATTSKILTRKGYETTMAGSGEEAIEILRKNPQDVVILDIKMPGMDGHQTLEEIKKIDADIPVIMLTGHGALESAKESLKLGAVDYLSKPCEIDLLAAKINDVHAMAKKGIREQCTPRWPKFKPLYKQGSAIARFFSPSCMSYPMEVRTITSAFRISWTELR